MQEVILIHYDEIAIKRGNRKRFERRLVEHIRGKALRRNIHKNLIIKRIFGRMIIELEETLTEEKKAAYTTLLTETFGIAHISFAKQVEQDITLIKKEGLALVEESNTSWSTFRVKARRLNKDFPLTSQEIEIEVGGKVAELYKKKVNLDNPEYTLWIDIVDKRTFIYDKKIQGLRGLPYGVNGKVLLLLSGGIDSPVASYYMQKRGLEVHYIHFHSYPYTSDASIQKVRTLVTILNKFSGKSTLYLCPFSNIQKKILYSVPEEYRIIFYRRMMFRIAEKIAKDIGATALVTGEALAQVASQTIENMTTIDDAINMFVLRPLVGFDKHEIIEKAKMIDTMETSVLPDEDCCTIFMPKSPLTRSNKKKTHALERELPFEEWIEETMKDITHEKITSQISI